MDFNEYQQEARKTAIYEGPVVYPALGLAGEAGECCEKIKKFIRGDFVERGSDERNTTEELQAGEAGTRVTESKGDVSISASSIQGTDEDAGSSFGLSKVPVPPSVRESLKKELGDVLWYVANLAQDLGIEMNEIAEANLDKLRSRQSRGKLRGDGDNR